MTSIFHLSKDQQRAGDRSNQKFIFLFFYDTQQIQGEYLRSGTYSGVHIFDEAECKDRAYRYLVTRRVNKPQ